MQVSGYFLHLDKSREDHRAMLHRLFARANIYPGQTARISRAALPPITGGLHCGFVSGCLFRSDPRALPPRTGGLHCGGEEDVPTTSTARRSRQEPAGSIAAAARWRSRRSGSPGAPAKNRRAPLRPGLGGERGHQPQALPPRTGGLHCGRIITPGAAGITEALPPITGGLHCGTLAANRYHTVATSCQVSR